MQERTPIPLYAPRTTDDIEPTQSSSTSTEYARARAREDAAELLQYAVDGGLPGTAGMAAYIGQLLQRGLSKDVLMDAITQTFLAPRPSWHYFAAICRRLQAAGIRSMEALDADKADHARKAAEAAAARAAAIDAAATKQVARPQYLGKRTSAHLVSQREYTDGELDELLFTDPDDLNP